MFFIKIKTKKFFLNNICPKTNFKFFFTESKRCSWQYLFLYFLLYTNSLCVFRLRNASEMAARPLVSIYNEKNVTSGVQIKLPAVYRVAIRPDLVNFIHDQIRKNKRQPYAVSTAAGNYKIFKYV